MLKQLLIIPKTNKAFKSVVRLVLFWGLLATVLIIKGIPANSLASSNFCKKVLSIFSSIFLKYLLIIINSAYRSPEHNAKIGGKPNSSHIKGLAVDISVTDSRTRFIVLNALINAGFNRIGIADTFIHVDLDLDKSSKVIWTY